MMNQYNKKDDYHSLLRQLIIDISKFVIKPWVKSMEYNFDNYWGELKLSFTVDNNTEDCSLITLRNDLLCYLNQTYPDENIPFDWQVNFIRKGKVIEVLLNEDKVRDINDSLYDLSA